MRVYNIINVLILFYKVTAFTPQTIKVSDYIVNKLIENNINTVFTYTGGASLPLVNSLYKSKDKIRSIFNRNEQFSAFSATGYAKASKRVGVLITTSGPGLTNSITGIQDAYNDGIPLIVISCQVSSLQLNKDAFQECNATELTRSCTKYNKLVINPSEIVNELDRAFEICKQPRNGPVHLDICMDLFDKEIEIDNNDIIRNNIINSMLILNKMNYDDSVKKNIIMGMVFLNKMKEDLNKKNDNLNKGNIIKMMVILNEIKKELSNKNDELENKNNINILIILNKMRDNLEEINNKLNNKLKKKNIIKTAITLNKIKIDENNKNIQKLIDRIVFAKAPVIIAGQGCHDSSEKLRYFAIKNQIPVITTLHGVGNFDEEHSLSLKMCGMHGLPQANLAIQNADLIIGIGYRFDDRTVCNLNRYAPTAMKENAIFHIDNSYEKIRKVTELIPSITSIHLDSGKFFDIINKKYMSIEMDRDIYLNYINTMKREFSLNRYISMGMGMPYILNKFSKILNEYNLVKIMKSGSNYMDYNENKIYITTGVGTHQMYAAQHITYKQPNTLLTSGSLGVMGTGLPYAIGASIANPKASVFCIDGDGSFMMSLQELATIREYNLPIKIMIMDNNNLGMVKMWQEMFYDNNVYGVGLKNPDFCLLAESFGIRAVRCNKPEQITPILNELVKYDGPMLVHFEVNDEKCLPFVPSNLGLDQMYLE